MINDTRHKQIIIIKKKKNWQVIEKAWLESHVTLVLAFFFLIVSMVPRQGTFFPCERPLAKFRHRLQPSNKRKFQFYFITFSSTSPFSTAPPE